MSASPLQIDEDLADQLIRDWQQPLFNFSLQWLRDEGEAADATQDIFLAVLRDLHQLRSPDKLKAWIFRVARSVLTRRKKRKRRREELVSLGGAEAPRDDADAPAEAELRAAVQVAVAELPEAIRAVVILRYYQGLTQHQLAEALDIPRTTAQSRLEKGLSLLRSRLPEGALLAVPELEALMANTAPAPVPLSLKAGLAALPRSPALWATAAGGALIMKAKALTAAIILAAIAFGGGYALSAARRAEEPDPTLAANSRAEGELARLRRRNAVLEEAARGAPAETGGDPKLQANARAELERARAANAALRRQLAELEETVSPDSPRLLLRKLLARLRFLREGADPKEAKRLEDFRASLKGLSFEKRLQATREFEKTPLGQRAKEAQQEFASIFMRLSSDRPAAMAAAVELLSDRGGEDRELLAEVVLSALSMQAGDLGDSVLDMKPFNAALLDLIADPTEPKAVRQGALKALGLKKDEAVQDRAFAVLIGLARGDDPRLRPLAWTKLCTMPGERAQREIRVLLLDSEEPIETRLEVLSEAPLTRAEDGLSLILQLTRDANPQIRRGAYDRFLRFEARPELRPDLSAALAGEANPEVQRAIIRALGVHGDAASVRQLEAFADDPQYSTAARTRAAATARQLSARLKAAAQKP